MIAAGGWLAEKPFNGHAGFHIWTYIRLFPNATWSDVGRDFWSRIRRTLLRTWTNTRSELGRNAAPVRPWDEFAARARKSNYKRGTVPKGAILLFLGVDCQIDRIEWQLVGRGPEHRKEVVDYGMIGKPIAEADCQRNLSQLLNRRGKTTAAIHGAVPGRDRCRL